MSNRNSRDVDKAINKLKNILNLNNLIKLSFSSGWLITKNELYHSGLEKLDTLFSATNLLNGKGVSIEYEEERELFSLVLIEQIREGGQWGMTNFSNSHLIIESPIFNDVLKRLEYFLVDPDKGLDKLAVPSRWYIRRNLLSSEEEKKSNYNIHHLFEAYTNFNRPPFFIEVTMIKKESIQYVIFIGKCKNKIPKSGTCFFSPLPFVEKKEMNIDSYDKTKVALEEYLQNPESFFLG